MQTILKSETREVKITTDGPVVVIGEKINPTGNKKLAAALQEGNLAYVQDLAAAQVAAGADVLDVNAGASGVDEVALLVQVVRAVLSQVNVPLCLDSANPAALAAALDITPGKPLVNSVKAEEASLRTVLPIIKDRGAAVIGLTLDDEGIPTTPERRLAVAAKIVERAASLGIPTEDIVIDPLVLTVGADSKAAVITLQSIELIRRELGVNIVLGASNVSFGLPDRHTLNQAFLSLAINAGASCLLTDPVKLTPIVRAVDLLRGRDAYARRYITNFRARSKANER